MSVSSLLTWPTFLGHWATDALHAVQKKKCPNPKFSCQPAILASWSFPLCWSTKSETMPQCCFITAIFVVLSLSEFHILLESLPTIERRAPVVNDAITSNETLAASRNAFLIGHLFAEFEADEEKQHKERVDNQRLASSSSAESEDDDGSYGQLAGEDGRGQMEGSPREVTPIQADPIRALMAATTSGTVSSGINGELDERKGKNTSAPLAEPIRPVNAPTSEKQHLTEHEADDIPLSRPTAAEPVPSNQPAPRNGSSTEKPPLDEEDATNPFIYPPTEHPEAEGQQPFWLRSLFFTVICTGIGFFLLMLLIGLLARFEGGSSEAEESQPRRPGDARVVPVEQAIVVVRPSVDPN